MIYKIIKKFMFGLKKIFGLGRSKKDFSKIFNNTLKKDEIEGITRFLISDNFKAVEISAIHIVNKLKLSSIECLANNDEERAKKEILMSKGIEFYLGEIRKLKECK